MQNSNFIASKNDTEACPITYKSVIRLNKFRPRRRNPMRSFLNLQKSIDLFELNGYNSIKSRFNKSRFNNHRERFLCL